MNKERVLRELFSEDDPEWWDILKRWLLRTAFPLPSALIYRYWRKPGRRFEVISLSLYSRLPKNAVIVATMPAWWREQLRWTYKDILGTEPPEFEKKIDLLEWREDYADWRGYESFDDALIEHFLEPEEMAPSQAWVEYLFEEYRLYPTCGEKPLKLHGR